VAEVEDNPKRKTMKVLAILFPELLDDPNGVEMALFCGHFRYTLEYKGSKTNSDGNLELYFSVATSDVEEFRKYIQERIEQIEQCRRKM
jgi:hypothetical protein